MNSNRIEEIKKFWDHRAGLKEIAGSNDFILKEIEIQAIKRDLENNQLVLEIGCGSGGTAIELAKSYALSITALDYSQSMIKSACAALANEDSLIGTVQFRVGDLRSLENFGGSFDIAFTERVLINLETWDEQKKSIEAIIDTLEPGGRYLMCENSVEGLDRINVFRHACGLEIISPPWHNNYLNEQQVEKMSLPSADLIAVEHISSSYYFVSRVINAWLAQQEGIEPKYDAIVNRLGLILPELGELGQTKLWVFEKK